MDPINDRQSSYYLFLHFSRLWKKFTRNATRSTCYRALPSIIVLIGSKEETDQPFRKEDSKLESHNREPLSTATEFWHWMWSPNQPRKMKFLSRVRGRLNFPVTMRSRIRLENNLVHGRVVENANIYMSVLGTSVKYESNCLLNRAKEVLDYSKNIVRCESLLTKPFAFVML